MNEEKRKRFLRVGCLLLAGVFLLSVLGSVVLMLLVCVALCVAGQRYMPEFFWIFAGVGALLVLCMVYRILLVRSVHLYADSKGVWLYRGILPWNRGAVGVKWRDMEDAAFTSGFSSWLFNSYTCLLYTSPSPRDA